MSWWDEKDKYLWQAMGKESMDVKEVVTDKEWALFIEYYADTFAERASDLAYTLWVSFLGEHPEIEERM